MKRSDIELKISITRDSNNEIRIAIEDTTSGIEFVEAKMSLEEFGSAVTGLACRQAIGRVRGLEYIGKYKVSELREIECPLNTYNRDVLKTWLVDNCQEEGWLLDSYLGSQNSVANKENKNILRYRVFKYVDDLSVY